MAAAVVKTMLQTLSSPIQKELGLVLGYNQELVSLSSTLSAINATLEDAEKKQFSSSAIEDWLEKLKDAAYELDDILEECAYHDLELEHEEVNCALPDCGLSDMVRGSCLSSFHPMHGCFRYQIAKRMKMIKERLDQIAEERIRFHLSETERSTGVMDWRQTISTISDEVYGREEDTGKIVDFLVGDASHFEDLLVYPIVGLGGLGKTTVAQLIFNHQSVLEHFEPRIWVCVSEDFSLKRMAKAIIQAAPGHESEEVNLEALQKKVQDLLQRKRYLLVLDDVWDYDDENWRRLKSVLACGGKGASILVTTRSQKVASIMKTTSPHELSKLSDSDCWILFKQRAFEPNEEEWADLEIIGREIVKKCGGVPLAAKAIGCLLRFKREKAEWLFVRDSRLWDLPKDDNSIMPALRLSYLNLPVQLRQCFAFCALFPKDERIDKQFMVELWMANDFISSNRMLDAEVIGDNVVNELYWRSFFQDVHIDTLGKITSFKLHDLIHDLAESVAEEVCCISNDKGVTSPSKRIRHLSIYREKSFAKVKFLKTYIMQNLEVAILQPHLMKCYSLRVLKVKGLYTLSTAIGHLKHLRYLNLSYGHFTSLPESLCMLWNLQILKLDSCHSLQKLPDSLICLKALQHLSLERYNRLSSLPRQVGKLTSLRNLSRYFVGNERGFLLAELGQLNLKGKLYIKHLERVKSVMDAKEANMSSKHLSKLFLSWGRNEESQLQENVEQILEALQPHIQELQTLAVGGYKGACFPQWMSSPSLKYLNRLQLVDCDHCLQLPQLGKLPSLKDLSISNMIHIKYLYEESYDGEVFMALEFLLVEKLPNLVRLSREEGENMFPRLSTFQITECPKLFGLPSLPSLNDLHIKGRSNQELLISIHKLTSLKSLQLRDNEELICFPNGMLANLTSLKKLDIYGLSKLEVLPTEMINLDALQELYLKGCVSLKSLTDEVLLQGLHSLKILNINGRCHKFNLSAGFQYLTSLKELAIENNSEVEGFHDSLQHMTSLQLLALGDLPNLDSLPDWLGNLGLLHKLVISKCPKLRCLPMSIQCLSGLKRLYIYGCPELGRRCEKEIGEDWPKIAHVQHISIENCGRYNCCRGGDNYVVFPYEVWGLW